MVKAKIDTYFKLSNLTNYLRYRLTEPEFYNEKYAHTVHFRIMILHDL